MLAGITQTVHMHSGAYNVGQHTCITHAQFKHIAGIMWEAAWRFPHKAWWWVGGATRVIDVGGCEAWQR